MAATVGSAIGLGNVWRFPAEVQQGGGAAFLLIYVGCVLILGIPVMLSEFAIGRAGRSDAVGSLKNIGARGLWPAVGGCGILASYLILCFYMVVAGWTLEYFLQSITGGLFDPVAGAEATTNAHYTAKMESFISSPVNPLINTFLMIIINIAVLIAGVQKGIERLSNFAMPLLFIILLALVAVSLSLPGAIDGVHYFLNPDFSKVTPSVVVSALGQAFFSLSLGMGILITYAAYYPKETRLFRTAVTVSLLDMMAAILMGVVIFPAVTSFGLGDADLEGTALVFVTLPEVFARMPGTQLWSALFFLLLLVAALTSTVSIAEVSVSFVQNRFHRSRRAACLIVLLPLFGLSALSALSFGVLSDWKICGQVFFDFLDTVATNIMLPVASILLCLFIGWRRPGVLRGELSNYSEYDHRLQRPIAFIVKWIAPGLILLVLIAGFL